MYASTYPADDSWNEFASAYQIFHSKNPQSDDNLFFISHILHKRRTVHHRKAPTAADTGFSFRIGMTDYANSPQSR